MTTETKQISEFNDAWKGRGNLANLVSELERQKEKRIDFVSDTRNFKIGVDEEEIAYKDKHGRDQTRIERHVKLIPGNGQAFEWMPEGPMRFNECAAHQLAGKCNPRIPTKFFDELLQAPNINRMLDLVNGLHDDTPKKRFVRCLDNQVRAWLSDGYRVIDNYDMAFTCLDEAQKKDAQIFEASLSDKRMRIKFTTQQVWDAIDIKQKGDRGGWYAMAMGNKELLGRSILGARITEELPGGPGTIHPVVTVSNSETGHGGFYVRIGILMGICFNVATLEDVVSQIHLGERLDEGIFSQEAISAESKAIMLKARDGIRAAFDTERFKKLVEKAQLSQAQVIEAPTAAVNAVVKAGVINEEQKEAVLQYFLRDYDSTRWGLAQAVSRFAQDIDDPDQASELEMAAGRIIKEPAFAKVSA